MPRRHITADRDVLFIRDLKITDKLGSVVFYRLIIEKAAFFTFCIHHRIAACILIRPIGILRPRDPYVVAAACVQPAKGQEQIIVLRVFIVQNIRRFDPAVVAAQ